jgi:hypothetical protein
MVLAVRMPAFENYVTELVDHINSSYSKNEALVDFTRCSFVVLVGEKFIAVLGFNSYVANPVRNHPMRRVRFFEFPGLIDPICVDHKPSLSTFTVVAWSALWELGRKRAVWPWTVDVATKRDTGAEEA